MVVIGLSRFLPTKWRWHVIGDAAAEHPVVVKNKHFFSKTNNTEQQVNAPSTVPRTYQKHKSEDLPLATNKDTPFNIDSQVGDAPDLAVSWRQLRLFRQCTGKTDETFGSISKQQSCIDKES